MPQLTIAVPAKINLSLDVVGRREDGYHLLSTIMQSIDLMDQVSVAVDTGDSIHLACNQAGIPQDGRNTAWRAAEFFKMATGIAADIRIIIKKNIPAAAGLAGGSADAAAVLFALDKLFPGRLTSGQLFEQAARIGADVPFCLQGGTVLCEGIGEVLTPLVPLSEVPLILCKPDFGLSTPWVFSHLNLKNLGRRPDQKAVINALQNRDLNQLAGQTANVLETVSIQAHPELQILKDLLLDAGAAFAMMSGSGPTVFGLFSRPDLRDQAMRQLANKIPTGTAIYSAMTCATGPSVLFHE